MKMLNHLAQVGDVHRSSLVRPIICSLGTDEGVVLACGLLELKKIVIGSWTMRLLVH